MNEMRALESACPEVPPLSEDLRSEIRREVFGEIDQSDHPAALRIRTFRVRLVSVAAGLIVFSGAFGLLWTSRSEHPPPVASIDTVEGSTPEGERRLVTPATPSDDAGDADGNDDLYAPVVYPVQLMEISPQDEYMVIAAWRERLNECLADKGQPAYEAELDSVQDIVAYRSARDAKAAGDFNIDLPERHGAGVLSPDPTVRACADVAERSVTTTSGWSLYAPPQESVDAQMEVNDRVYERLADARAEWSACMVNDFGYDGADMSASPNVWSTPVDLGDPDQGTALEAADERCRESIDYYGIHLQLSIEETLKWADENAATLDRLAAEAEEVMQTIAAE